MASTRKEMEMADELVRLRKAAANARMRVEEALRLLPEENTPLRKKLQAALTALDATSPSVNAQF